MIINALRFRAIGESAWQSWKFQQGTGRFSNYQCLAGGRELVVEIGKAVDYVLTGKDPEKPTEVMIQLSDASGRTWIVQRRPGLVRYLRDGETLAAGTGEMVFAAALMDLDEHQLASGEVRIGVNVLSLYGDEGRIAVRPFGSQDVASQAIKKGIAKKIRDIAIASARTLNLPNVQNPKVLARLAQRLEPVYAQYREVERLARDFEGRNKDLPPMENEDFAVSQRLGQELEVIEEIRIHATPLLAPGAPSLKALKDLLAATEANISALCQELGTPEPAGQVVTRDYSKAIDALSRLEAHGKLIRASQMARKYCEQKLEVPFKKYLELVHKELLQDQTMIQQLDDCLAKIHARLRVYHDDIHAGSPPPMAGAGSRTWFDRFKAKSQEDEKNDPLTQSHEPPLELELARQVVSFALGKLHEMAVHLKETQTQQESALLSLDQAHEELVRGLGRLRDYWLTQARELELPESLDLGKLLKIVVMQGQLVALVDQKEELKERVQKYSVRLARVERLVTDWRCMTGSQKQSTLDNTGILLQEARDIIRYHEVKRKKFDHLATATTHAKAGQAVKNMFGERRTKLMEYWHKVFTEEAVPVLDIASPTLPELFKASSYIKALALVHGESQQGAQGKVFDTRTESAALSIYVCEEPSLDPKARFSLLSELENAQGKEQRLLLIADEGTGQAIAPLGLGMAVKLSKGVTTEREQSQVGQDIPRPTLTTKPVARPVSPKVPAMDPDQILADRAQRALNILTGKVR